MKQINLRLCVAGSESLIPQFQACLNSYRIFFKIGELVIYTTENLFPKVDAITTGKADKVTICDVDKFYKSCFDKFPQPVKDVLEYSKNKGFKDVHSMFYLRMRLVMDYYFIDGKKPFILSDIDAFPVGDIQPILDWLNSDYVLYNADFIDNYYSHCPNITKIFGEDYFKAIPQFNNGWMCIPKGFKMNIKEVFEIMRKDIDQGPVEMAAIAISFIRNDVKTKLLPREMMVTKKDEIKGKILAHLGPYGL